MMGVSGVLALRVLHDALLWSSGLERRRNTCGLTHRLDALWGTHLISIHCSLDANMKFTPCKGGKRDLQNPLPPTALPAYKSTTRKQRCSTALPDELDPATTSMGHPQQLLLVPRQAQQHPPRYQTLK